MPDQPSREPISILVFSAALRRESLNTRLARLAAEIAAANGAEVDLATMAEFDMPAYDGDEERNGGLPPGADELRRRLERCDGFIICSPEYNASMPGLLKNAIDWVSRFRPQPFNELNGLLLSASPSMVGGNRGLWALRVPFEHLGARMYPDMFSLARAHEAFDEHGRLAHESLGERLAGTIVSFLNVVEAARHYPCVKTAWVEFLGEHPDAAIDRTQ